MMAAPEDQAHLTERLAVLVRREPDVKIKDACAQLGVSYSKLREAVLATTRLTPRAFAAQTRGGNSIRTRPVANRAAQRREAEYAKIMKRLEKNPRISERELSDALGWPKGHASRVLREMGTTLEAARAKIYASRRAASVDRGQQKG